ncbi:hypothetical protein LCGC14_0428420 [marine sediment metagenome]|uniref:Uncharacterized protein n=1 Tax=marine sediment metagenome TaxID=412755 RepID=A0A0F9T6W4_9ZZZZ
MEGELGLLQEACYRRLLDHSWLEDGLPNDETLVKAACGNPRRWEEIWALVSKAFTVYPDGKLRNKRIEEERAKQKDRRASTSAAGKQGATKRWGKKPEPKPKDTAKPENSRPNPSTITPSTVVKYFHAACPSIPGIKGVAGARQRALNARIKQHPAPGFWQEYFLLVETSDFLCGRTADPFKHCTFDWLLNEANMNKILEGNYINDKHRAQEEIVYTGAGEPG